MEEINIVPAGDSSVLIEYESRISPEINKKITFLVQLIRSKQIEGVVDMIPTFCSLLVNYDPRVLTFHEIRKRLEELTRVKAKTDAKGKKIFEIPVCYGGQHGPDIKTIADHAGLSEEEVIKIHTSCDYLIYMLGFLPGFCYLGGLDERIHTPRLSNPRAKIPAGSVGIAGNQTGIYPLESPGGWQLMGLTPVRTYDPGREPPILVQAGDYIRFVSINEDEFNDIKAQVNEGSYKCRIFEE